MTTTILLLGFILSGFGGGSDTDFERLKTLVGEWEASSAYGKSPVSFKLTANGTVLMETAGSGAEAMITVYHADGDATMMTHYCSAGNQPRMRAQKSSDGKAITFKFIDATNKETGGGYMSRLVIKFKDADNVVEEWTWKDKGEEKATAFELRRVKK